MKVSIVIPYYSHLKYVDECIISALNQTYENYEIVIVNDESPDEFDETVQKYLSNSKIKYYKKKNGGGASALNYGIERSSGEIILPLCCDDVMLPTWIQEGVKMMTDTSTIVTTIYPHYVQDLSYAYSTWITHHSEYDDLIYNNTIGYSSMFYKHKWEEIGKYDEEFMFLEDWEFWIRMVKHNCVVKVLHSPMIKYRVHTNNFAAYYAPTREFYYNKLKQKHDIKDK